MPQSDLSLSPPPVAQQVVGGNGLLTQPWALWMQKLQQRVGGGSTTPLDQANDGIASLGEDVKAAQTSIAAQDAQIVALHAAEAQTTAAVAALAVSSGDWTPTITGATGPVSATGHWRSITGEVFVDILLDATAGPVTLTSATCDIPVAASAPGVCAVLNATAYKDFGHGLITGGTIRLPDLQVSGAVITISGRYRS